MKKSTQAYVAKTEDIQEIKRYLTCVLKSYTNTWGTATQTTFLLRVCFQKQIYNLYNCITPKKLPQSRYQMMNLASWKGFAQCRDVCIYASVCKVILQQSSTTRCNRQHTSHRVTNIRYMKSYHSHDGSIPQNQASNDLVHTKRISDISNISRSRP